MRYLVVGVICLAAATSNADTVLFKDGSKLNGKVEKINDNLIALKFQKGQMKFRTSEIESIEKNDKTAEGSADPIMHPQVAKVLRQRQEETGLTSDQRRTVVEVLQGLESEDTWQRDNAHKTLVKMSENMDVFKFLESSIDHTASSSVPGVMNLMMELNPERSFEIAKNMSQETMPVRRSVAILALAKTGGGKEIETIARGMVDWDSSVQITAANALGTLGEKRATPLLLQGLDSPYKRVHNAAIAALSKIWNLDPTQKQHQDPAFWNSKWKREKGSVQNPIATSSLKQLTPPVPTEQLTEH